MLKEHPIMKGGVRILRLSEYEMIRGSVRRDKQIPIDCTPLTGMRYEELLRYHYATFLHNYPPHIGRTLVIETLGSHPRTTW